MRTSSKRRTPGTTCRAPTPVRICFINFASSHLHLLVWDIGQRDLVMLQVGFFSGVWFGFKRMKQVDFFFSSCFFFKIREQLSKLLIRSGLFLSQNLHYAVLTNSAARLHHQSPSVRQSASGQSEQCLRAIEVPLSGERIRSSHGCVCINSHIHVILNKQHQQFPLATGWWRINHNHIEFFKPSKKCHVTYEEVCAAVRFRVIIPRIL